MFLVQMAQCDRLLELQNRLEIISSWMVNTSHSLENSTFPGDVERLSSTVLPEIRISLVCLSCHCTYKCVALFSLAGDSE